MGHMGFVGTRFTKLEQAVLRVICEKHPLDRAELEAQLSTAIVHSRENSGTGFYTFFSVAPSSSPPITGTRLRIGAQAKVDGLKYGMGFNLWLEKGYADCIEGYSYDEDTMGIDLEQAGFEIEKR